MKSAEDIEIFSRAYTVCFSKQPSLLLPWLFTAKLNKLLPAGSRDDLGDFSKDSLQEALDNANLLHEKGSVACVPSHPFNLASTALSLY